MKHKIINMIMLFCAMQACFAPKLQLVNALNGNLILEKMIHNASESHPVFEQVNHLFQEEFAKSGLTSVLLQDIAEHNILIQTQPTIVSSHPTSGPIAHQVRPWLFHISRLVAKVCGHRFNHSLNTLGRNILEKYAGYVRLEQLLEEQFPPYTNLALTKLSCTAEEIKFGVIISSPNVILSLQANRYDSQIISIHAALARSSMHCQLTLRLERSVASLFNPTGDSLEDELLDVSILDLPQMHGTRISEFSFSEEHATKEYDYRNRYIIFPLLRESCDLTVSLKTVHMMLQKIDRTLLDGITTHTKLIKFIASDDHNLTPFMHNLLHSWVIPKDLAILNDISVLNNSEMGICNILNQGLKLPEKPAKSFEFWQVFDHEHFAPYKWYQSDRLRLIKTGELSYELRANHDEPHVFQVKQVLVCKEEYLRFVIMLYDSKVGLVIVTDNLCILPRDLHTFTPNMDFFGSELLTKTNLHDLANHLLLHPTVNSDCEPCALVTFHFDNQFIANKGINLVESRYSYLLKFLKDLYEQPILSIAPAVE